MNKPIELHPKKKYFPHLFAYGTLFCVNLFRSMNTPEFNTVLKTVVYFEAFEWFQKINREALYG